jgi:hypothetical protein
MSYAACSLDDFARSGGIATNFNAGATPLGHHWDIRSHTGALLARTDRVHKGGKLAQAFWKAWTVTGMGVGDDIHVELVGAQRRVLARATSVNDNPAIVTVTDPAGKQVARSVRERKSVTVYGDDDQPLAEMQCEGDGPWPVRTAAGDVLGELLAGEPGPSVSPKLWEWAVFPDVALNSAAYSQSMHLGLRRVRHYAFEPFGQSAPLAAPLALLPILAGLTY